MEDSLDKKAERKMQTRGYCALKQETLKRGDLPVLTQGLKSLNLTERYSLEVLGVKNRIYPTGPFLRVLR